VEIQVISSVKEVDSIVCVGRGVAKDCMYK
jgi:hypothetical protein